MTSVNQEERSGDDLRTAITGSESAGATGRTWPRVTTQQDDFPPAAGGVDGEGLLEALLNVRAPHALSVPVNGLVIVFPVQPIFWATVGTPLVGRNGGGSPWARPRAPKSRDL
ncbi:hypothetical protein PBY51_012828 [Eleginops maclovinus]|uniref:Uncharacterized protein n=1 Tax=Eleginops maclovinus TaxID=56733 RepID=A0AAN8AXC7_ELEMC|nr:hypothetical protein PBY51_012828 [Eleginops maclovinus]